MLIIGCDYQPGFQQIAWWIARAVNWAKRRLVHREEAAQFYQKLHEQGLKGAGGHGSQRPWKTRWRSVP